MTGSVPWVPADFEIKPEINLKSEVKHEYNDGLEPKSQLDEIEEIENNENCDLFAPLTENSGTSKSEPPVKRKRKETFEEKQRTPTKRERQKELAQQQALDREQVMKTCKICHPGTTFLAEKVYYRLD